MLHNAQQQPPWYLDESEYWVVDNLAIVHALCLVLSLELRYLVWWHLRVVHGLVVAHVVIADI